MTIRKAGNGYIVETEKVYGGTLEEVFKTLEEDDEFITTVEFGKSIIFSHYEKAFSTDKNYPFARFAISQQACEKLVAEWRKFVNKEVEAI